MAITAADVNKLRTMTGVGMMDCKNALVEANGDFDKAVEILRKKGQKVAANRADREANEGFVFAQVTEDKAFGSVVMINCESDFVGKNDDFIKFVKSVSDISIKNRVATREDLLKIELDGMTIDNHLTNLTGKIGEKIEMSRYESVTSEYVAAYNHNGNRLAAVVGFNKSIDNIQEIAHDVAMQVAAMAPIAINPEGVDKDFVEKELEIARELTRQEGKPEDLIEKIAQGKLNRFFKENTLVNQEFFKDTKTTVGDFLKSNDKDLECTSFARLQLGA